MLNVTVCATSGPLRDALTEALGEFAVVASSSSVLPSGEPNPGEIVVAPVSDCTLETCGRLSDLGWRVVVLAPVPREPERVMYLASGATDYVPMTVQSDELLGAIVSAAGDGLLTPTCK